MPWEAFTNAPWQTHLAALSPIACLLLYLILKGR